MRLAATFVVASWCLAALVLVCAYNGLLISYVMASNPRPLVESITDLASKQSVQLLVDEGRGLDMLFSVITKPSYYIRPVKATK